MGNTNWLQEMGLGELKLPKLSSGSHRPDEGELCAMEMVAFMERLPHSDRPSCTCPIIATLTIAANDSLDDERRQTIMPILPRVVGTVAPEFERLRAHAVVESVLDLIVGLKTLARLPFAFDEAGRRVSLPPQHYVKPLAKPLRDAGEWHTSDGRLLAAARAMLEHTEAPEIVGTALEVADIATSLPDYDYIEEVAWPRLRVEWEDGSAPGGEMTLTAIRYAEARKDWHLRTLERVLAIGPKGKWTSEARVAAQAVKLAQRFEVANVY